MTKTCEAAMIRGTIKHSHLENAYLMLSPKLLYNVITSDDDIPFILTRKLINRLIDIMEDSYSPIHLLHENEHDDASTYSDDMISHKDIHDNYLKQSDILDVKTRLININSIFEASQDIFIASIAMGEDKFQAAYEKLKQSSIALRDILAELPKGFWLP